MQASTVGLVGALGLAIFGCGRTANKPSTDSSQVEEQGGAGSESASSGAKNTGSSSNGSNGGSAGASFISGGSNNGGSGFASNQSCHAGQTQCMGNMLYGCDLNLDHLTPLVDCTTSNPGAYCNPKAKSGPACDVRDCEPGATRCNNTTLFSCGADGHWSPGAEDQRACPPPPDPEPICQPFTSVCADGLLEVCLESGLAYATPHACPSGSHCLDQGDYDQCIRNACQPGETACLGNQVGVCASDGQSLSRVTLDCPAQGQICYGADCSPSLVERLAPSPDGTDSTLGIVELVMVDVHSSRTLSQLNTEILLSADGLLHWLVYEGGSSGYVLLYDGTSPVLAGSSRPSSGELSLPLRAGRRYAFGLSTTTRGSFFRQEVLSSRELSFGRVYGSNLYEGDYHSLPADLDPNDYEILLGIQTTPQLP
jgi:hypothetical protein